jgi:nitrite reductase (NO-forming)
MKRPRLIFFALISVSALLLSGCYSLARENISIKATLSVLQDQMANMGSVAAQNQQPTSQAPSGPADVTFTLSTATDGHNLAFVGVGGEIDGVMNPVLKVQPGDIVEIHLVNGQATEHSLVIDEFGANTGMVTTQGEEKITKFVADKAGLFKYYCDIPGHRAAGMEGVLQVGESAATAAAASIIKNPSDLPGPIGDRGPTLVKVELVAQEVEGQLADGTTTSYFTFNGTVPGPFIRARVGDTVEVNMRNETSSTFVHSVDLHAVNGPGGGAVYTQVQPGETKVFTFKALAPGIFVYHCATPSVPHHISMGMYGLILIEPEGGLPKVDREFYVVQGEIYTVEPFGTLGHLNFSEEKLLNQTPEYFVFNGASKALTTEENRLNANVGDTVRIYIGVGGPNFTSSFHVIGEIFDRVYPFGSLTSAPLTNVQTILIPPGGATVVEFRVDEPGDYAVVDHALSRLERGLLAILHVEGEADPTIFHDGSATP